MLYTVYCTCEGVFDREKVMSKYGMHCCYYHCHDNYNLMSTTVPDVIPGVHLSTVVYKK